MIRYLNCEPQSFLAEAPPTHRHRLRTDKDCAVLTNILGEASLKSWK